jgi:hypothetical protein
MRIALKVLVVFICFGSSVSFAQGRKSTYSYKYKSVRMSRSKAQVVCPIFENSEYPYHGIGIKVGDPVALTYKYYQSEKFAIAVDAGSAASGLYSRYHREQFTENIPSNLSTFETIRYTRHEIVSEYVIEGKILYQTKAEKIFPGLQSYAGLGWQLRRAEIRYSYFYETNLRDRDIGEFIANRSSQGPTATIGFEYAYFKLPVSTFMEITGFMDVMENPGWTRLQGGIGIRYVF